MFSWAWRARCARQAREWPRDGAGFFPIPRRLCGAVLVWLPAAGRPVPYLSLWWWCCPPTTAINSPSASAKISAFHLCPAWMRAPLRPWVDCSLVASSAGSRSAVLCGVVHV
ncbi:unnamed protein product, partial [Amoebophrya sp. A120]|eukprot:GSA120T00019356001.1